MADKEKGANLKKIVTNLDSNRKNVQAGLDVPENIKSARAHFTEFQNVIKGQTSTISSLKTYSKSMNSESTRNLEARRFFSTFVDRIKDQLTKFMKTAQGTFASPNHKSNKEEDFKKCNAELNKMISSLKDESDNPQKIYSAVMKLLSIRDHILSQFLKVMLYKKNVLWRDLNIRYDDYIHGAVKKTLIQIKESEQKYGFIPTTLEFKVPKLQINSELEIPDLIDITLHDYNELIESMKNFSKLSENEQLIEDINKNQHIVKGLRDKIESLTKNYNVLMEKYRSLQISKGKAQLGANEEKSLNEKIQDLESLLMKKEQDIIEIKQNNMKNQGFIQSLKDKNKELEDQISKWQNFQLPKIKELQNNQKTLLEQFSKAKKDFQTYSGLYEVEREEKIKAYQDLKDERKRLSEMANILGRQRRKIKELKTEINRKQQIIMEIVEKAPQP